MHDLGVVPINLIRNLENSRRGACKYHPHGDVAYILLKMAQQWSLRYTLVDGQGNFGSIDGDSPAAMRYTEARLAKIAEEALLDIDKNTVDFTLNFDDTLETISITTRLPNLLIMVQAE